MITAPTNPVLAHLSPHLHHKDPLAGGEIAPAPETEPSLLDFVRRWRGLDELDAPQETAEPPRPPERQWPALFTNGPKDPSEATETIPADASPPAAADPVPPFFMKEIPEQDIQRLHAAAEASGQDFEALHATYLAQRRQLLLEIQRRADAIAREIAERDNYRDELRKFLHTLRQDAVEAPPDPHHGIKLAVLLMPADEAQTDRIHQLIAHFDHDRAETLDGGRLGFRDDKVTVRKGSPQAVTLLIAEAKARGWQSIEASGTKEFCTLLAQHAQQEGIALTAYVRFPSLAPPIRVIPGGLQPDDGDIKRRPGQDREADAAAHDSAGAVREASVDPAEGTVRQADPLDVLEEALEDPSPAP